MNVGLHLLQEKLPEISVWIKRTLVIHAAAARSVASIGFQRIPAYYPPELLNMAKVVVVPNVPMPPLRSMGLPEFADFESMDAAGITYHDTYFVRGDVAGAESLHFHELVHVVQWNHLGADRFLMSYALGHLLTGGYRTNPLETMAYDLQFRFERDSKPFDAASSIRRSLDVVVAQILSSEEDLKE